jgi:hypothetical protein
MRFKQFLRLFESGKYSVATLKGWSKGADRLDAQAQKQLKQIHSILVIAPSKRTEEQEIILKSRFNNHLIRHVKTDKGRALMDVYAKDKNAYQFHLKGGNKIGFYFQSNTEIVFAFIGNHDDITGG